MVGIEQAVDMGVAASKPSGVPLTRLKTQRAQIEATINQEVTFARLCTAFGVVALVIACVGLYGTMSSLGFIS